MVTVTEKKDWFGEVLETPKVSCVYGIFVKGLLVYVGSTTDFAQRRQRHWDHIKQGCNDHGKQHALYAFLQEYANEYGAIEIKSMIDFSDVKYESEQKLTRRDLEVAELALIYTLRPAFNRQNGRDLPYMFDEIRQKIVD